MGGLGARFYARDWRTKRSKSVRRAPPIYLLQLTVCWSVVSSQRPARRLTPTNSPLCQACCHPTRRHWLAGLIRKPSQVFRGPLRRTITQRCRRSSVTQASTRLMRFVAHTHIPATTMHSCDMRTRRRRRGGKHGGVIQAERPTFSSSGSAPPEALPDWLRSLRLAFRLVRRCSQCLVTTC